MGGRGSKGAKSMATPEKKIAYRSASTDFLADKTVSWTGEEIDLSKHPLRYGKNDPNVSKNDRLIIDDFEVSDHVRSAGFERILFTNGNGMITGTADGDSGSVGIEEDVVKASLMMTHSHPRSEGAVLGGTFSDADLNNFLDVGNLKTMRATAGEGTYSISRLKNFDVEGFRQYALNEHSRLFKPYYEYAKETELKYTKGEISYKTYLNRLIKKFNRTQVAFHNHLLAGQEQYGYFYTLERIKNS